MSKIPTKHRILEAAAALFNSNGLSATPLRHIASAAGISIGNLAYHFKNKDLIVEALYHRMEEERIALLTSVQQAPTFEHIHQTALPIINLNLKYRFFYMEPQEMVRNHPSLSKLQQQYIQNHIAYLRAMLDYSVGVGNIEPEPFRGAYGHLAERVWMLIHFWILKETVRGATEFRPEAAREAMWEMVFPHFTEKGKKKYIALYQKAAA